MPPRFRPTSGVLNPPRTAATKSYQMMKKGGYYHHHDRHYYSAHQDGQNKASKPQKTGHKGNKHKYKAKVKATGKPHDPAAVSYTTSIRDNPDSEPVYDAQASMHKFADGSNESNFGLRKVRSALQVC